MKVRHLNLSRRMQRFTEHSICIQRKLIARQCTNYALRMSTVRKIFSEMGFDGQAETPMTLTHPTVKGWRSRRAAPPPPPSKENLKDADFVDTVASKFYLSYS